MGHYLKKYDRLHRSTSWALLSMGQASQSQPNDTNKLMTRLQPEALGQVIGLISNLWRELLAAKHKQQAKIPNWTPTWSTTRIDNPTKSMVGLQHTHTQNLTSRPLGITDHILITHNEGRIFQILPSKVNNISLAQLLGVASGGHHTENTGQNHRCRTNI